MSKDGGNGNATKDDKDQVSAVNQDSAHEQDVTHAPAIAPKVFGGALFVLSALQLMVVLDGTVVNLALARIQAELGLSDSLRSWVVTAYALSYGGLLLLGGRLGDAFGRKKVFLIGVSLFTLASLACGLSGNPYFLIVARMIQGAGAAIASPTAMALLVVTFPPGKARNQAFSVFAMMTGVGSVLGLVIGGALTQASWRWIFLINIPIGVLIVGLGLVVLKASRAEETLGLDVRGAILATCGSTLLVFGLAEGGAGSPVLVASALVLGVVVLALFFRSQRLAEYPVLPLNLLSYRPRAAVFVCLLAIGAALMAMTVQVALFVQEVLGYSPLKAGLAFIPFAFALGTGSAIASKLAESIAPRWIVAGGAGILVAGFLYAMSLDGSISYTTGLLPPILVIGVGIGIVLIPLTLSVVAGAKPTEVGPLTASSLVCQTLGGPIGLAAATAVGERIATAHYGGSLAGLDREALSDTAKAALGAGYTGSLGVCLGLAAFAAVVAVLWVSYTTQDIAEGKAAEQAANQA